MQTVDDLYTLRSTWVHAIDPRAKLLFVVCSLFLLLVFKNLLFMVGALGLTHLLHWSARIPRQKIGSVWKALLPVSILMGILWVLFYPTGIPVLQVWAIKITPLGIAQGLVRALRIITMGLVVAVWLYTTDPPSIVRSLVKLGVPFEWGLILALALRYIPFLQGMYSMISEAQQARGLDISEGTGFRRLRVLMPIFIAMIISSLRACDQLANALESRALGARHVRRTYLRGLHFRPMDYLVTVLILIVFVGLLYLNRRYGFGVHSVTLL